MCYYQNYHNLWVILDNATGPKVKSGTLSEVGICYTKILRVLKNHTKNHLNSSFTFLIIKNGNCMLINGSPRI